MSHHLLEVINLSHTYSDGTHALADVSFRVTHGESVAIIGANGAGKSTLLLHLNGCLTANGGSIRVGELPLNARTLPAIRRSVGMVFQNPDDQLFMPTVFEDVAFGPFNLGLTGEDLEVRVDAALGRVGADHLRNKPPYLLSAGEKKRVAIASVIAMNPDILVMDEPTNGLDPWSRRQLIGLLKEFSHTKIITSHDLDMVYDVCTRVIVMHRGTIRASGTPEQVFKDDQLLNECHLERPLSMQGCRQCGSMS